MKKLIALLMVLAMVACLFVGCDKNDKQGSDAPQVMETVGPHRTAAMMAALTKQITAR
ncbi:MAG: hypothetical protein U0M10_05340 [Oscillospiraceae bacterium]|nr:hypothetical protein [Oscillospiraceae bacterium]